MRCALGAVPVPTEKDIQRFRKYLRRDASGCLLWVGHRHKTGYGRFRLQGKVYQAHVVAFVIAGGVLTEEKPWVLHDCPAGDNRACCEEAHLWAGTHIENMRDMARKGRGNRRRKSSSGLPVGVRRKGDRFHARRYEGRVTIYVGAYATAEEAACALALAKHGDPKRGERQ